MKAIENSMSGALGHSHPITSMERFVRDLYASVDEVTAGGLQRVHSEAGLVPTCTVGCCHCCRQHILTNPAEAHTLAQHVRREWPADRINALQERTRLWHAWDYSRPGRDPSLARRGQADFSHYDHCCPLLTDGACSVYPVRPVTCRTHYVTSPADACRAANDPHSTEAPPVALTSLVAAAGPLITAMQRYLETTGVDSSCSIMLLPHSLAIEMDWDFAIDG